MPNAGDCAVVFGKPATTADAAGRRLERGGNGGMAAGTVSSDRVDAGPRVRPRR